MKAKESSYQKLKAENAELKQTIHSLIMFPNTPKNLLLKATYKAMDQIQHLVWAGDISGSDNKFKGITNQPKRK